MNPENCNDGPKITGVCASRNVQEQRDDMGAIVGLVPDRIVRWVVDVTFPDGVTVTLHHTQTVEQ